MLMPAGLVLLFVPLNTHRTEEVDKGFVFIKMVEVLTAEPKESTPDPPLSAQTNMTMEGLMDTLKQAQSKLSNTPAEAAIENSYGYPTVTEQNMAGYPALQNGIHDLALRSPSWSKKTVLSRRLDELPVEKWLDFKKTQLADENSPFQYGNNIFEGIVEVAHVTVEVEVKYLKSGCKVAGGIFIILSILAMLGLYRPPTTEGIHVGKKSGVIAWDVVIILIGIPFSWMALELGMAKLFEAEFWIGNDQEAMMGVFWILLGNPLMALITTATSVQTIHITSDGITSAGIFGTNFLAWQDIKSLHLSRIVAPRGPDSIAPVRKVTQKLVVQGASYDIRVMEPPCYSTKRLIFIALRQYAPDGLKENIEDIAKEW